MFSKFFINRPIFATVLAIIMVIAGLLALTMLPVAQYPDISAPTVMVGASYPGADAQTVSTSVGEPIEQAVNGVEGMLYMSSTSTDGNYQLTITFENGTDVDEAAINVQNRISEADATLPNSVKEQGVQVMKRSGSQLMMMTLQSDNPELYDALYLTNYGQLHITDPLSRVKGVGDVQVFGGGEYSMRVWLDPGQMQVRGITPQEVAAAIEAQNTNVAVGQIGAEPTTDNPQFTLTVTSRGQLSTPEEFGEIILRNDETGFLRLRDVARVELGSVSYGQAASLNGKPTAMVGISQLPTANALDVAKGVKKEMENLSKYFPEGVTYSVVLDTTTYVHKSIEEVLVTLLETSLIVMVVILIFLQNWRAVIIPMITIPVSLIGTLVVMKLLGFTINTLTLFGLVLAIALVVDDAIVVVEDCSRLVDTGKLTRHQAATKAMNELTGPVIGEVLVLLSVFIPTAFVSGITGKLYKQFALTIATATAISGFNALTLTPSLCALFLNPRKPARFFIYKWFNAGYSWVFNHYKKLIGKMLDHWGISMLVFLGLAVVGAWFYIVRPSSYIPAEDMGYFMTNVTLPDGAALERTEKVVTAYSEALRKEIPEIQDVMEISGVSFMGGGNNTNGGALFVILKPWKDRKGKAGAIDAIIRKADEIGMRFPEAQIFSLNPPSVPGLGLTSGLSMQLLDINNLGAGEIEKAMKTIQEAAAKDSRIKQVTSTYEGLAPQYRLNIDRDQMTMRGISAEQLYAALTGYMSAEFINDFTDFSRLFQVTISADGNAKVRPEQVLSLTVTNDKGEAVPIGAVADIEEVMGTPTVSRYNMYTTAGLTATPADGVSSSDAIQAMEEIVEQSLGQNFSYAWTGEAYQETQAGMTISIVFIFAVLMTLLVLAAQYESWTDPVAVVLAMPTAIIGTLIGVVCLNQSVSIYTQIGLILLLGLAAKNAILIVEYAMDYRKTGMSIQQAAADGGAVRFRPILMTAFAFVFGVMPMLFASGPGAGSRKSLGTAIVFGMAVNAVLGTTFVPVFWKMMQMFREKYLVNIFRDPAPAEAAVVSDQSDQPDQSDQSDQSDRSDSSSREALKSPTPEDFV